MEAIDMSEDWITVLRRRKPNEKNTYKFLQQNKAGQFAIWLTRFFISKLSVSLIN